jgi:predicted N-acyltransferase
MAKINLTNCLPKTLAETIVQANAIHFSFYRSMVDVGSDWEIAAPSTDIFLQRAFLQTLESYPPLGMRFGYLIFYKNDIPVGVALCQTKHFKGNKNIIEFELPRQDPCFFNGLAAWVKRFVAGFAAADILIFGNILVTGEHGYYFDYQKISQTESINILEKSLNHAVDQLSQDGIKIPVLLVKDIGPKHRNQGDYLSKNGFREFDIQPNMVLELPFKRYEDYLSAMSTKYRTRAKRAEKKLLGIKKVALTAREIEQELPAIYKLYQDVAKNAGFNMIELNRAYFLGMKQQLGDCFRVFGYYLDNRLVAFYTTFRNDRELEAHFLGFEKSLNHDFQLYLNILYDIIKIGIETGCERIVFARTALEIKSSIGAMPHELWCYVRHQNSIANKFTATLLDYLKPVEEWLPRHPFKEEVH